MQGRTLAKGAYNVQAGRPVLGAGRLGAQYEDVGKGVLDVVRDASLWRWNGRRWISLGKAFGGRLDVISPNGWYMTENFAKNGTDTIRWANVRTHVSRTITARGNVEAMGSDWAIIDRGGQLVLAVPTTHTQRVIARGVVDPLVANNSVYWTLSSGHVERVSVLTSVTSAVN